MSQDVKKMMHDMQDRIREVAYLMWESAGRQHGMATEYWHAAEREVRAALEAASEKVKETVPAVLKPEAKKPDEPKLAAPAAKAPAKPAPAPKPAPKAAAPAAKASAKPAPAPKPAPKPAAPAAKAPAKPAPAPKPSPKPAAPTAKAPAKPAPAPKPAPKAAAPAAKAPAKPAPAPKPAPKPAAPAAKAPAKAATVTTGYKTEEIEGIGPAYAKKLASVGIATTEQLLDQCGSAKGRSDVADRAGITAKLLLKWVNMADLMRISGIAGENAELLEAAGVDTVKELKMRNAENLAAKMAEINAEKKLTRRVASAKQVEKWVEQAKSLEPKVTH